MKKLQIVLVVAALVVLGFFAVRSNFFQYILLPMVPRQVTDIFFRESEEAVPYNIVADSSSYREYEFDGSINPDSGSWDLFWQLRKDKKTLHKGLAFTENEMDYAEITETDEEKGVIQKYNGYPDIKRLGQKDVYEVRSDIAGTWYTVYKNDILLYKNNIKDYGPEGPVVDWRIEEGKPALTLSVSCPVVDSVQTCIHDVFYGGEFMNKKYDVEDSRYLFAYNGKIGFVAKDNGKDRIFFDGSFITPAFDEIHTQNCCSIQQILPTVYENGVLVFYAAREEKDYLVEVKLI